MRKIFIAINLLFISAFSITAQSKWSGNESPTYDELHLTLKQLASKNKEVELYNMGNSDYGLPIYVCIVNGACDSTKTFAKARNETTILINNAIHPGEPDGVNAMLLWLEEWIKAGKKTKVLPVIAFIPAYNVGGMMNRSSTSRANQNGPKEYGFRGNARNLDLNRDFIKMDAENTFTFARIFHSLDPDVFVDNHVSNGADYQYTLTYISSLKERLAPSIQRLTYEKLIPELKSQLQKRGTDLFPYVELKGETPAEGIVAFNDLPRYAMGYASLFHSLSFTVETHMLKPFPERVQVTKQFMEELTKWTFENKKAIENVIKVGIALSGKIADFTEFDRKNYFYPDIPKGYQISQYKFPIVSGGQLADFDITRIHLEEDTANNKHDRGDFSLIDFNRAGVPLMELVTEPHTFETDEEAAKGSSKFAKELQMKEEDFYT